MGKNLSSKYEQKLLDTTRKLATDALNTASNRTSQKMAETTDDFLGKKIPEKITKAASKNIKDPKKSEPNTTTKMLKEIIIPPEKRQQIIDELRLL